MCEKLRHRGIFVSRSIKTAIAHGEAALERAHFKKKERFVLSLFGEGGRPRFKMRESWAVLGQKV